VSFVSFAVPFVRVRLLLDGTRTIRAIDTPRPTGEQRCVVNVVLRHGHVDAHTVFLVVEPDVLYNIAPTI
jgi:hypothetical protein